MDRVPKGMERRNGRKRRGEGGGGTVRFIAMQELSSRLLWRGEMANGGCGSIQCCSPPDAGTSLALPVTLAVGDRFTDGQGHLLAPPPSPSPSSHHCHLGRLCLGNCARLLPSTPCFISDDNREFTSATENSEGYVWGGWWGSRPGESFCRDKCHPTPSLTIFAK